MAKRLITNIPEKPQENPGALSRRYLDSLCFEERIMGGVEAFVEPTLFDRRFGTPIMASAVSC